MFSNLFSSSISLATVTPSLVTRGAPNDLSSTTLRPLGPRGTRTASARMSIPCNILSRASTENFTSLAAIVVLLNYPLRSPVGPSPLRRRRYVWRYEDASGGALCVPAPRHHPPSYHSPS